jgi:uncharacterized Zn finger protein
MSTLTLIETTILQYTSEESFFLGREYYRQGVVLSLVKRGMTLRAEVQDSVLLPYVVRCAFGTDTAVSTACTCSHHGSGWCKHIIATCLAAIHQPEKVEERPTIEALLLDLNREQLEKILVKLVEREPALVEVIEAEVIEGELASLGLNSPEAESSSFPKTSPQPAQVDAKALQRQVGSIMHNLDYMRPSEAYGYAGAVVNAIDGLLDQARKLIEVDDGRPALKLLAAITKEYISDWTGLDDSDGELSDFFYELGPTWTEALLTIDLSRGEREFWDGKLKVWQDDIGDYGVDDALEAARQAARQGWDYPPLQRVLQGDITQQRAWNGEVPVCADELTKARLRVLERRGRLQEYLYLAKAEGQAEEYATMLVRLDRAQEAADYGREHLKSAQEALSLAKALYDRGERELGLQIAEHGLTLEKPIAPLAYWLRDTADTMGKAALALSTAELLFREELNLTNYIRAGELAGVQWPQRGPDLLDYARHTKSYSPQGLVDVFLYEGLIDDAIATVEYGGSYDLIRRVVDAAMDARPEWVIQICRQQAEPIMDGNKSQYYDKAADWLSRARMAYRRMNHEQEWQAYLAERLDLHRRQRKLVPLLEALRK